MSEVTAQLAGECWLFLTWMFFWLETVFFLALFNVISETALLKLK